MRGETETGEAAKERLRKLIIRRRPHRPEVRAWAAGIFEGEGTATMSCTEDAAQPMVSVGNTDLDIVMALQRLWPGVRVYSAEPNPGRHKKLWTWRLHKQLEIVKFIADVLPFVRSARTRERLDLLDEVIRRRFCEGRVRSRKLRARIAEVKERLSVLNHRGVRELDPAIVVRLRGAA